MSAALPYRPGVGIMLLNQQRKVFVGQRIDSTAEAWQMPQGGVDPGEDAVTAAFRELEEETGIIPAHASIITQSRQPLDYDLPQDLVSKLWKGRYRGQRQDWFLLQFHGADADVNIATEHAEFCAWQWVEPVAVVDLIVPFKRALYAQVLEEFASHLDLAA